jgi:hypothetical protein
MQDNCELITKITKIRERMFEINVELSSMSYSQSNPGTMMNRRLMRKELDKLEQELTNLIMKKKD